MIAQNILIATGLSFIPTLFWAWFWMRGRNITRKQTSFWMFIIGIVVLSLTPPFQTISYRLLDEVYNWKTILVWAGIEEILKLFFFIIILNFIEKKNLFVSLILYTLGFVTAENLLYMLNPIWQGDIFESIAILIKRFYGATNMHILTSLILLGSYFLYDKFQKPNKYIYIALGGLLAIVVHTIWNYSLTL
jgi:RsiW-degrading membrane proteinase PrsW (M82 family)